MACQEAEARQKRGPHLVSSSATALRSRISFSCSSCGVSCWVREAQVVARRMARVAAQEQGARMSASAATSASSTQHARSGGKERPPVTACTATTAGATPIEFHCNKLHTWTRIRWFIAVIVQPTDTTPPSVQNNELPKSMRRRGPRFAAMGAPATAPGSSQPDQCDLGSLCCHLLRE